MDEPLDEKRIFTEIKRVLVKSVFKGSPDPSHFIFEIKVGKSRIRHRTTLNLNNTIDVFQSILS